MSRATDRRITRTMRSLATAIAMALIGCSAAEAAFPGQNGKIAFQRGGADTEIFTVEPDGTAATRLTSNSTFDGQPVWSPSGSRIAFWGSGAGDTSDIYVMNQDGTGLTNVTNTADRGELEPAWSPDGTKIAFTSSTNSGVDIFVMNANGSSATQITTGAAFNAQAAWSPDGSRIAYVTNAGYPMGDFDIVTTTPTGGGPTQLTSGPTDDLSPDWSPDGTRIVFHRDPERFANTADIWVMNADGSGQTALTSNSVLEFGPAFSPDGTKIAFARGPFPFGLVVMNADGTGSTQITTGADNDTFPDWQAVGPNRAPDCSGVAASPSSLSTSNHKLVTVTLTGATDPDGDAVTLSVTTVTQDEPTGGAPDAATGAASNEVLLRAERDGSGNGRVYRVAFQAADGRGGTCDGTVEVGVPKGSGAPVDSAPPSYDSFGS
jgi:TolB protein